ncbi:MAG: hypothetical protein COB07_11710 [Sulfurovum sp.]|nr:MAG: hypothetical protein COB07_11710 [Sulfurovum sp.]
MRIFLYNYKYILFIKLVLLTLFTSEQSSTLFYPFVSFFTDTFQNPWQYYIDNNLKIDAFPFHSLMLYILTLFAYPLDLFDIDNYYLVNLFFKFPLFLTDIGIFILLLKVYSRDSDKVVFFYFFNPIVIYAIYILSLPEIIPVALLFLSVFYLYIKKNIYKSAAVFGLTLATSLNFIIALPLILTYVYKVHHSFKKFFVYSTIVLIIVLFFDLPYLFSDGFVKMVILNKMQLLFFDTYFSIGQMKLYLSLFAFAAVYYLFYIQKKVYYDILISYFGMLLTVAIILTYPSPELYVWIVPFFSAFLIREKNVIKSSLLLYMTYNAFYLIFFILFFKSGYNDILFGNYVLDLKIENSDILENAIYTMLLILNSIILFVFYQVGIKSKSIYIREQNLVIGIGGDSGSGKSLLLGDISLLLNQKLLKLEGDGEHKWERGDLNWEKYTHLDPKANFIYKQASIISQLKSNQPAYRSDYDHDTGKFTAPFKVEPKQFISISALHPFYLSYMRNRIDFKIYIDTDESLRRHWKIIRDVASRGYTIEKIIKQIETRVSDAKKYIYPQKKFADFIIKYYPLQKFELGNKSAQIDLGLQLTFSANIQIEKLLNIPGLELEWDYNDDLNTQHINIKKEPDVDFDKLANEMIPNRGEITAYDHTWLSGYRGLVQLFIVLQISEIMKSE